MRKSNKHKSVEMDNAITGSVTASEVSVGHFKKRTVIIAVIIILIIMTGFVFWLVQTNNSKKQDIATITAKDGNFAALSSDDINNQKYNSGKPALEKAANDANGKERALKLTELSLLALNVNKYDEALRYAAEAEKADTSYLSADLYGRIYLAKGDKAQAINWYKIALERSQKSKVEGSSQLAQEYQAKIKQLEGAR